MKRPKQESSMLRNFILFILFLFFLSVSTTVFSMEYNESTDIIEPSGLDIYQDDSSPPEPSPDNENGQEDDTDNESPDDDSER